MRTKNENPLYYIEFKLSVEKIQWSLLSAQFSLNLLISFSEPGIDLLDHKGVDTRNSFPGLSLTVATIQWDNFGTVRMKLKVFLLNHHTSQITVIYELFCDAP